MYDFEGDNTGTLGLFQSRGGKEEFQKFNERGENNEKKGGLEER